MTHDLAVETADVVVVRGEQSLRVEVDDGGRRHGDVAVARRRGHVTVTSVLDSVRHLRVEPLPLLLDPPVVEPDERGEDEPEEHDREHQVPHPQQLSVIRVLFRPRPRRRVDHVTGSDVTRQRRGRRHDDDRENRLDSNR